MAKDKKKPVKKSATETKVTRIIADSGVTPAAGKKEKVAKTKAAPVVATSEKAKRRSPIRAIADYFSGAWYELRQVRWPNRRATWGMTVALLAFTAFFVAFILLLDALFKYLFQLILG
jgi:preprotein translocase SecE subunit